MKRFVSCVCLAALFTCCFSKVLAQPRVVIKANIALANIVGEEVRNNAVLQTFQFGGQFEFPLNDVLGIGFGAEVVGKGARITLPIAKGRVNPIYLQVPVQFTFRTGGLFVGLGPFVGVGIGGKNETNGKKSDISFGPEVFCDYSRTDYGAGLELGYEFGSLRAFVSYNQGYANIVPKEQADLYKISARSSVFGFGLAYIF